MGDSSSGTSWDRVDIATFVLTVEAVKQRLEPVFSLWKFLVYVTRWESSVVSFPTFCILQVFCWWPEYLPLLLGMAFCAIFLHGLFVQSLGGTLHSNSHKYLAAKRVEDDAEDRVLSDHLAKTQLHSEQLNKYRSWLCTAQTVAEELVLFLDSANSVVRWHDSRRSIRWLLYGLLVVVILAFLPFHWTLTLVLWSLFLCNTNFLDAVQRHRVRIWWWRRKRRKLLTMDGVGEGDVGEAEDNQIHNHENGASGQSADLISTADSTDGVSLSDDEGDSPDDDSSLASSAPQKNTVVSRWKELRQRRKLNKQAHCAKCGISLSSILRKRHYCRKCGQDFCSNCCSDEVPRSVLGATAPAAQFEKVRVCCDCHASLRR